MHRSFTAPRRVVLSLLCLPAAIGLLLAWGSGAGASGLTSPSTLQFSQVAFSNNATWLSSTFVVPTTVHWTAKGQYMDAWVMGENVTARAWTQVGWKFGTDDQPEVFTQTNPSVGAAATALYPQFHLTMGSAVTAAVSCQPGTSTWSLWLWWGATWHKLQSAATGFACGSSPLLTALETDYAGGSVPTYAGAVPMFNGTVTVQHGQVSGGPSVAGTPAITTSTLPSIIVGVPYVARLGGSGGIVDWTVISSHLPAGLSLSSGGLISGIPTATGPATFVIAATRANGATAAKVLTLRPLL